MRFKLPRLEDVFVFSNSSEFSQYQKWYSLWERDHHDVSVKLTMDDVAQLGFWPAIQKLYEDILPEAVSVLKSYKDAFEVEMAKYEKAVKSLEGSNKLFEFYKAVLDRLTKMYLDSLSGMLTEVYSEVYSTDSKKVQLQMTDFRNKKVIRLNIINHIDGHDYVEDFSQEGGSAQVILGIIVALYFILVTGAPRIIFVDECLGSMHDDVLVRFLNILKQFVDQLGFCFVLIAHDAYRMKDFISKVYLVEGGVYKQVPDDKLGSFLESIAV